MDSATLLNTLDDGTLSQSDDGVIERLRKVWDSEKDTERRNFICDLLQIYDHDWRELLDQRLEELFLPQNWKKIRLQIDTSINLLAWASDELGGIYNEPAARTIEGNEDGLEPYVNEGELDAALDEAARLCFALRQIVLRPLVVERDKETVVVLDVVPPDRCCILPDKDDPLKLNAIAVRLSDARWSVWTDEQHWVVGHDWKPIEGDGGEAGRNPYKTIPYVLCHARYPSRGHWSHQRSKGLLEATYQVGVGKTDHQHLRHTSSFKQMYIRQDKVDEEIPKQIADPTSVVQLRGQTAEAGVIDMQADLPSHLESLMQGAQATLALYGIRPEAVKGTVDASSGYALSLKMHKQQQVWGAYRRAWTRNERELYRVARVVWAVDAKGKPPLPEGKLEIEYAELGPGQDPIEQANRAEVLLRVGWSKANVFREVFGKDDDWIEANEAEKMEERANMGDELVPPPFGQDPKQQLPPKQDSADDKKQPPPFGRKANEEVSA